MRTIHLLAFCLGLQPIIPPANDDDKVPNVPDRIAVMPGHATAFKVEKNVEAIRGFSDKDCTFIRLSAEDGTTFYLVSPRSKGQYPVMFRMKDAEQGKLTMIDAGEPLPPKPPKPKPPEVDPALRSRFEAAYLTDGGAQTGGNEDGRKSLAELYRQAADLVKSQSLTTGEELRDRLRAATATLTEDRLTTVRTLIAELIGPVIPLSVPLTPENRQIAAALFLRIAVALDW